MSGPSQRSVSIDEGVKFPKVSMLKPKSAPIGANYPVPGSKIARPCSSHTAPKAPLPPPAEPRSIVAASSSSPKMRRSSDPRTHLEDVYEENEYEVDTYSFNRSPRASKSPENKRYDRKSSTASNSSEIYFNITGESKQFDKEVLTEDTDSFIIGNRVWVGGKKPGKIAYLGECHFAPGTWAGVVLDEAIGKNDGSVDKTRYFQCEPKKGVFSRLTRLTREPIGGSGDDYMTQSYMSIPSRSGTVSPTQSVRSSVLRTPGKSGTLKIGDRVIASAQMGSRRGTLRYMGGIGKVDSDGRPCIFAGIELDDASGKNNGTLDSIYYFECPDKHGIFVPIEKVSLSPKSNNPRLSRANSRESLMSHMSIQSSATNTTTSRLHLSAQRTSPKVTSTPKVQPSLQDVLREKQTQLQRLMTELELEKEVNSSQSILHKKNMDEQYVKLKELTAKLEEEKRRTEDLQFMVEELRCNETDNNAQLDALSLRATDSNTSVTSTAEYKSVYAELKAQEVKTKTSEDLRKSLENQIQSLNEKLVKQQQKIHSELDSQLTEENEKLKLKIEELGTEMLKQVENNKSQIAQYAETEGRLQLKLEVLESELSKGNVQLDEMRKLLDEREKMFNKLSSSQVDNQKSMEINNNIIDEKDKQIEQLKALTTINEEKMSQSQNLLEELQSKLNEFRSVQAANADKLADKDSIISKLEGELKSQLGNLNAVQVAEVSKISEKENEIKKLEAELKSFEDRLENQRTILEEKETSTSSKEILIQKLKSEIETLHSKMTENNTQYNEQLKSRETEIEALKTEHEKMLQSKLQLDKDIIESVTGLMDKDKKVKELNDLNEKLSNEIIILQEDAIKLKQNISDLNNNFIDKDNIYKKLNIENGLLNERIAQLELVVKKLEAENTEVLSTNDAIQKNIELQQTKYNSELLSLSDVKSSLELKVEQSDIEIENLKKYVTELQLSRVEEMEKLEAQINEKALFIETLNTEIKNKNLEIASERQLREEVEKKSNASELSYLEIRDHLSKMKIEKSDLQRQLKSLDDHLFQVMGQKEEMSSKLDNMLETTFSSDTEIRSLNDNLKSKQKAFDDFLAVSNKNKLQLELQLQELAQLNESLNNQLLRLRSDMVEVCAQKSERENELNIELAKMKEIAEQEKANLLGELEVLKITHNSEKDVWSKNLNKATEQFALIENINVELVVKTEKDIKLLNKQYDELKAAAEQERNEQNKQLEMYISSEASLKSDLEKIKSSEKNLIESLNNLSQTSENGCKEFTQQMSEKNTLIENLEKNLSQMKINIEAEVEKRQKFEDKYTKSLEEIAELTTTRIDLTKKIDTITAEKSSVDKALEELRTQLNEATNKFKETEDEQVDLVNQNEKLKEKQSELEKALDNLKAEKTIVDEFLMKVQKEFSEYQISTQSIFDNYDDRIKESNLSLQCKNLQIIELDEKILNLTSSMNISEELKLELKQKEESIAQLNRNLIELQACFDTAEAEHKKLVEINVNEIQSLKANLTLHSNEILEKSQNLEATLKCLNEKTKEVETIVTENSTLEHKMAIIQNSLLDKEIEMKNSQSKIIELITEKEIMQKRIDEILSNKQSEESQSNETVTALSHQLQLLEAAKKQEIESLHAVLDEVQSKIAKQCEEVELQYNNLNLSQKREQDLEQQKKEVQRRENELKMLNDSFSKQISLMQQQLKDKDLEISTIKENAVKTVNFDDDTTGEGKIAFLNSIIADMQIKNENLVSRIKMLEAVPGDAMDLDFLNKRKPAPRAYCDICEEFDYHETEDCPIQCSDTPSPPKESDGDSKIRTLPPPRKYCENCETFDHESEECTLCDDTF